MNRFLALLRKDLLDLRQHPGLFLPALLTASIALILPFVVAIVIPGVTGERLSDSNDFERAMRSVASEVVTAGLTEEGAVQAWVFQQFLPLLMIGPVAASMSIAAHAVIGEKQARTLEPLLATPLTTAELLLAKVASALLPTVVLTTICYGIYALFIALLAEPGVVRILLVQRSLSVFFLLGPLAALAALQMAVCVSSRVNDTRSAQQIGALVILPLSAAMIGQLTGSVVLTMPLILMISGGLVILNLILMRVGIALFDRETILTRWK